MEDGSTYKVPLTEIKQIFEHPRADRLEVAQVYGFNVIVQKDKFKAGDRVIYIPVDSILPQEIENTLFPPDSKIKLNKHRVKQIRIRKIYSQGMLVRPEDILNSIALNRANLEDDLKETLGITKYDPPIPTFQKIGTRQRRTAPEDNPYFRKFNGITNIKWEPNAFDGEEVVIQCKLHGTHTRFGKAPFVPNNFWKKVLKFFKLTPEYEDVYGSNNVELTNRHSYVGYYGDNIYRRCLEKFDVFNKIKPGEFVHAEIIGPGIQKGYTYGHTEHHLVIFDVRVLNEDGTQRWLNPEEVEIFAKERGFDFVPVLYKGPFSKEILAQHTSGPSVYCPAEPIREGCVVKSRYNYDNEQNKRALKSINPDYLNTDPSDNH